VITIVNVAHRRWSNRIWLKQAVTLHSASLLQSYEVADGQGDADYGDLPIVDHGARQGRGILSRLRLVIRVARRCNAKRGDIVHFHDPIFLPGALWLKLKGRRIVYDVHEDYPRQVLNWELPAYIRNGMSAVYWLLEWMGAKAFDGIVAATPTIAKRFPSAKTVVVHNFPRAEELYTPHATPYDQRPPAVVYIGGITRVRGAFEMMEAISLAKQPTGTRLLLAGSLADGLKRELQEHHGWGQTEYVGQLGREELASLLGKARVGLALLHPTRNHLDAYPTKLFEYMSAGLPVVVSSFPLWKGIVEGTRCGVTVDPQDPSAIAGAIEYLLTHPEEAEEMGENGRRAVLEKYNWDSEASKLLTFYRDRLGLG